MALEIKATFRVFSKDMSLAELSDVLGEPSKGFSIGDKFSKGRQTRDISYWAFETKHIGEKASLDDHLYEIIRYIQCNLTAISKLKKSRCSLDIICLLDSDNGQGGANLSATTMKSLSEFGLDLSFDVYADCE